MHSITSKPKLVFFQYKYDRHLPAFLVMHARAHASCLSQFFEVSVIDEDCDYQEICERYQPDLAVFESGVPFASCRQPRIANTWAHPQVLKVGLLNADAFGEGRAGFLSDMDHWGIETFFAIATTAAEHNPEIADRLFVWPNSVDATLYRDYGQSKNIPVLFTGSKSPLYPWRQQILRLVSRSYPSLICPHPGYDPLKSASQLMVGERYARLLNASFFVPACGTIAREVVRKHFEIPACRSCLVTQWSDGLEAAGFVDMDNCVFAEEADVLNKLEFLFAHPDRLEAITDAGYQLAQSRHTAKQRDQILQWYRLRKTLAPNTKIVQPNPFGPLGVVPEAVASASNRPPETGSLRSLLREGDEMLWKGEHSGAEPFYLKCINYYRWMPEPQLRLALCNLYKGNAKLALSWIIKPIQCTLAEYKATDPDPVEWAYLIVTLLCLGRTKDALQRAGQFPWLHHPELDRVRLVIGSITNGATEVASDSWKRGQRRSIHRLPRRDFQEWTRQLSGMLASCGQTHLAQSVVECAVHDTVLSAQDSRAESDHAEGWRGRPPKNHKGAANAFKRRLLFSKAQMALKPSLKNILRRAEAKCGYLLPARLKRRKNDEYVRAIQERAMEKTFRSALIIGAEPREDSTQALLTVARAIKPRASFFGISLSKHKQIPVGHAFTEWHRVHASSPELLVAELDQVITKISDEYGIDHFDMLVIDGSELQNRLDGTNILEHLLRTAKCVVLDDINRQCNHANYAMLLEDSGCLLVECDLNRRNGYAIFERTSCEGGEVEKRIGDVGIERRTQSCNAGPWF